MSGVFGELHEVGGFEEVLQLGNHRAIARFLQMEDDFRCGHLHRVEAEALTDILTQRVGKTCVVFLLVLRSRHVFGLDFVDGLHGFLVRQHLLDDADARDNGLVGLQTQIQPQGQGQQGDKQQAQQEWCAPLAP